MLLGRTRAWIWIWIEHRASAPRKGEVVAGEKAEQAARAGRDAMSAAIHEAEQTGALRHLYGQPLDLSDDSPEWFARKLLKREGAAPPLVECGKDLDAAQQAAEVIMERVRRRRAWLASPAARCTPVQAEAFNKVRQIALAEYRAALIELNRGIRDYNLVAPLPMQRRGYIVDKLMTRVEQEIAPLDMHAQRMAPAAVPSLPSPVLLHPLRLRLWRPGFLRKGRLR